MSFEQKQRFKKEKKNTVQLKPAAEKPSSQRQRFELIGISSTLREYRLCFFLNKVLQVDFQRKEDLEVKSGDRQIQYYSRYHTLDEQNQLEFLLFTNKAAGSLLQQELPQFDFLLRVKGKIERAKLQELLSRFKTIEQVVLVAEIDTRLLKDTSRLVYHKKKTETRKPLSTKKVIELMRPS